MPAKRKSTGGTDNEQPKAKAAKTATSAKSAAGAPPPTPAPTYATPSMNAHMVKVHASVAAMMGHPIFTDIATSTPLTVNQGGLEAPYNHESCKTIFKDVDSVLLAGKDKGYDFGGNFCWIKFEWLNQPHVPVNPAQVRYISTKKFPAMFGTIRFI